jgi:hypothetical protein
MLVAPCIQARSCSLPQLLPRGSFCRVFTLPQAEVAFNLGLIDTRQRREAEAIQYEVVELVRNRQWTKARKRSDELLACITTASASATLEDIRRDKAYDAEDRVSVYLNLPGGLVWVFTCMRGCVFVGLRENTQCVAVHHQGPGWPGCLRLPWPWHHLMTIQDAHV